MSDYQVLSGAHLYRRCIFLVVLFLRTRTCGHRELSQMPTALVGRVWYDQNLSPDFLW